MSAWLVVIIGLVYMYIGLEQGFRGNWGVAVMFAGYAFSNVGIFLQVR